MKNSLIILSKIIIIFTFFSIVFYIFNNNYTYAEEFNVDVYKPNTTKIDQKGESKIQDVGQSIVGAVRILGSFMSVFALIIIGIKYMTGSIEEKAEYKKTLLPYFIGCIMVFGIINIVSFIYDRAIEI